jgi:hypothetical protein
VLCLDLHVTVCSYKMTRVAFGLMAFFAGAVVELPNSTKSELHFDALLGVVT